MYAGQQYRLTKRQVTELESHSPAHLMRVGVPAVKQVLAKYPLPTLLMLKEIGWTDELHPVIRPAGVAALNGLIAERIRASKPVTVN